MNNDEIKSARTEYYGLLFRDKSFLEAVSKIDEEKFSFKRGNPIYEGLLRTKPEVDYHDEYLDYTFGSRALKTQDDNGIYVCMGCYSFKLKNGEVVGVSKGLAWTAVEYRNIETMKSEYVSTSGTINFEKSHSVIFLDPGHFYGGAYRREYYENKFNKVRNKYFSMLVSESQEDAAKKLLKK